MENKIVWMIIIAVAIIVSGIFILTLKISKKEKYRPDYYAFFIMGIIWFPIGLVINNTVFWVLGLILAILGLSNRNKWKKHKTKWSKVDKESKILLLAIMFFLILLVVAGLLFMILYSKGII